MQSLSRGKRWLRLGAAVAGAMLVAACSSTGGGTPSGPAKIEYKPEDFLKTGYCPPIQIRGGTEVYTVYERGHNNEPAYVRYQASITRTARECRAAGAGLTIKVGVSGRVVAGPKGAAANLSLPLRIVVVKQTGGDGPLFTKLYKIPVAVAAPKLGADYSQVFEDVTVQIGPDDRNLLVYVGYDSGPAT